MKNIIISPAITYKEAVNQNFLSVGNRNDRFMGVGECDGLIEK